MFALLEPLEKETQMSLRGTCPPRTADCPAQKSPSSPASLNLMFLTPDLLRVQVLEVMDKFASAATGVIPVVTGVIVAVVDVEDEEDAGAETTGV